MLPDSIFKEPDFNWAMEPQNLEMDLDIAHESLERVHLIIKEYIPNNYFTIDCEKSETSFWNCGEFLFKLI